MKAASQLVSESAGQQVSKSASQRVSESDAGRSRTRHFRDLIAWQKGMMLAKRIYKATETFPAEERFGLTSQMRRAAVSVPSNIAEGHGRLTDKGLKVFLAQSRGSLFELETQLELCHELKYLDAASAVELMNECNEVARIINGLVRAMEG